MIRIALIAAAALFALPAAAQVTASLPVTCNASATSCIQAQPVTNPDGTAVGAATASAASGVAPASSGPASGVVIKASAGNDYGIDIVNGASAGFAILYNSATVPADGAITPALVLWCMPISANQGLRDNFTTPLYASTGISFFVSSASCVSKTAVAYNFVSGLAK